MRAIWSVACGALVAAVLLGCRPDDAGALRAFDDTRRIPVVGGQLSVRATGDGGDTVLVVPGGPGWTADYLAPLMRDAAQRHRVLLLTPRGRGSEADSAGAVTTSLAHDADDLVAVIDSLRLGRVALVAHDYGALVVAAAAPRLGERISRLVMVAPAHLHDDMNYGDAFLPITQEDRERERDLARTNAELLQPAAYCASSWPRLFMGFESLPASIVAEGAERFCRGGRAPSLQVSRVRQSVLRDLVRGWDVRDSVEALQVPALVLLGTGHRWRTYSAALWAYRLTGGVLLVTPGPATTPWLDAKGRDAGAAIAQFLDGQLPDGATRPADPGIPSTDTLFVF